MLLIHLPVSLVGAWAIMDPMHMRHGVLCCLRNLKIQTGSMQQVCAWPTASRPRDTHLRGPQRTAVALRVQLREFVPSW